MAFDFDNIEVNETIGFDILQIKLTCKTYSYVYYDQRNDFEYKLRNKFKIQNVHIDKFCFKSNKTVEIDITVYNFYGIFYALDALLSFHVNDYNIDFIYITNKTSTYEKVIPELDLSILKHDKKLQDDFFFKLVNNISIYFLDFHFNKLFLIDPTLFAKTYQFDNCNIDNLYLPKSYVVNLCPYLSSIIGNCTNIKNKVYV